MPTKRKLLKAYLTFLRVRDKWFSGKDRIRIVNRAYGRWRVRYNDGERSEPMAWNVACDYAEIFKGRVVWMGRRKFA